MLGRRRMAAALLALLSGVLLAACASAQPSAGTLARDAVRAFDKATVKTIQGSFTDGVIPVSVMVTVGSNGAVSGTGRFDHFPVTYVQSSKETFVEGTRYWAWERLGDWQSWTGLGSTWVKTDAGWDPATSAFQRAARVTGLVGLLGDDARHVSLGSPVRWNGRQVDQLVDGPVAYYLTTTAPYRLVAAGDAADRVVGGTVLGPARFSIGYGGVAPEDTPAGGQYVDQHDPSSLPAYYDVTDVNHSCQSFSCAVTATVQNQAGAPMGQSVVTITEYDWPGFTTPLAFCQAAIPPIGHNASATVGCTVTGPELTDWFDTGGEVGARATISSNPPYWT